MVWKDFYRIGKLHIELRAQEHHGFAELIKKVLKLKKPQEQIEELEQGSKTLNADATKIQDEDFANKLDDYLKKQCPNLTKAERR